MQLVLDNIGKQVGAQTWLYPMSMPLREGGVTVLLGATEAGKTSLMRIMAGLDAPSSGRVRVDGTDVTGVPVRRRNVAMVYQQFINYPSLTVAQNIASPLKLRGEAHIDQRVRTLAERLHIEAFLDRYPAQLSGGQQQRVALARALAKGAPLMLLDEPLVNLDYKLREELREELTQLFAVGEATVVYATTEPSEALLLGGYTAVLHEGELLQYGPTAEVFHVPRSLRVARAFSDPPMNFVAGLRQAQGVQLPDGTRLPLLLPAPANPSATSGADTVTLGLRASSLRLHAQTAAGTDMADAHGADLTVTGVVQLAEISGSDTFVHTRTPWGELVAQLPGIYHFKLGETVGLHVSANDVYVFGEDGALLHAPARRRASAGG